MYSVLLVACGVNATWTRSRIRGADRAREGRKIGGRVATIVENTHTVGEDGSYSYGWRSSDGSFKKETRLVTGEVSGEFGYKDAAGDIIITRYGVNTDTQFGFKGEFGNHQFLNFMKLYCPF